MLTIDWRLIVDGNQPHARGEKILRAESFREPAAVPYLVRALEDREHYFPSSSYAHLDVTATNAMLAVHALTAIGSPECVAALRRIAEADPDDDMRRIATGGLIRLQEIPFDDYFRPRWTAAGTKEEKAEILSVCSFALSVPAAARALERVANDPGEAAEVRETAGMAGERFTREWWRLVQLRDLYRDPDYAALAGTDREAISEEYWLIVGRMIDEGWDRPLPLDVLLPGKPDPKYAQFEARFGSRRGERLRWILREMARRIGFY